MIKMIEQAGFWPTEDILGEWSLCYCKWRKKPG